jgi:hypothetical protein
MSNSTVPLVDMEHPQDHTARGEVDGQRVPSATDPQARFSSVFMPTDVSSRSVSDVSNHPLPNRTGQFLSNRLSRGVPLPIGPDVPSGTAFSLDTSPCGPSPCPGRYPRRSSTMTTPSPCGSRRVGDPAVPIMPWSVHRFPLGA